MVSKVESLQTKPDGYCYTGQKPPNNFELNERYYKAQPPVLKMFKVTLIYKTLVQILLLVFFLGKLIDNKCSKILEAHIML